MTTPGEHLQVELVADLMEGLLAASEEASARRHLAECAQCASLREQLTQTQALLAEEGSNPVPMPAAVVARIDAALGAEPPPRRAPAAPIRSPHRPGQRASSAYARRPWLPKALVAAASVAVVGAAVAVGIGELGAPGGSGDASTQAGADRDLLGESAGGAGAADPEPTYAEGSTSRLRLDQDRFDEQVADSFKTGPRVTSPAMYRAAPLSDLQPCVSRLLGARAGPSWKAYHAELDGDPVNLIVQSDRANPRKVWALDCANPPRVRAVASLPR